MAEIGMRKAEIVHVVEEILSSSFVVINTIVNIARKERRDQHIHADSGARYVILDKIPTQIEYLNSLIVDKDIDCLEQLRISRNAFARLHFLLKNLGGLTDSRYVSVNEKVASFLSVLSHHKNIRVVKFDFKRSGQTISKYFHTVLTDVLKLHPILQMNPEPVDGNFTNSSWKHFKGCLGALDGTYIKVNVPETDKPRYRTRKGDIAVNVLGVCDTNMKFTYILTGWEGSATDCRVLCDAVSRDQGLKVPQGHYYLCDNGYMNVEGFLTPYKGVRYHLDEWGEGSSAPQNYKEYFNMHHSKARNVIEISFGLLKKRWSILRSPSFYPLKAQNRITMACTLLHNFLSNEIPEDPLEDDLDDIEILHEEYEARVYIDRVESSQAWSGWRDNMAHAMFADWRAPRNH